jgi:hypothetical protein
MGACKLGWAEVAVAAGAVIVVAGAVAAAIVEGVEEVDVVLVDLPNAIHLRWI